MSWTLRTRGVSAGKAAGVTRHVSLVISGVTLTAALVTPWVPLHSTHTSSHELVGDAVCLASVNYDGAAVGVLQLVKAPEECGFAAAGWTDDYHNLTFVDIDAYALENFQLAEILL